MNATATPLRDLLRAIEPNLFLVPRRLLRRVVRRDRGLPAAGLRVPHADLYWVARESLLGYLRPGELGTDRLPDKVLLFAPPPADSVAPLRDCWRRLFHAAIDRAIDRRLASGALSTAALRERTDVLGPAAWQEAQAVLRAEGRWLPPGDTGTLWREFVALYLELQAFTPHLLPVYFPGLPPAEAVDAAVRRDVPDPEALLERCRPAGAPAPWEPAVCPVVPAAPTGPVGPGLLGRLVEAAAARGNDVRAAILAQRTAPDAPPERTPALPHLSRLADRLQTALPGDGHHQPHWREALVPLLLPAARGLWPPAARLLYDLQKVCVDHERPLYAVDLVEWIGSLGRRPIRRLLTAPRDVRALRYLRSAERRLAGLPITDGQRFHLGQLLHEEIERAEHRLRERLRPELAGVLDAVGLSPADLPEAVSQAKLVDELLDHVIEKGFLSLGDVRDAVARNQVKLPDLGGPWEFLAGDPLLRAHRRLKVTLDGVYRRAEFYLRWLQSISSLFFGTPAGRWLTLWVLLPFGGAWLFVIFLHLVPEESAKLARLARILPKEEPGHHHALPLATPEVLLPAAVLGVFFLGVMHWPAFRRRVGRALWRLGQWLWLALVDVPVWVARSPLLRPVFTGPAAVFFLRYLLAPTLAGAATAGVASLAGADGTNVLRAGLGGFGAVLLLCSTRYGQGVQDAIAEAVVHAWRLVTVSIWAQLFRFVMDAFRTLLEQVERGLYAVDEWLRFREGENPLMLPVKAVLGLLWFGVTWVVRLYINLLIEPQINPIKHFPTVTVAAKLLMPVLPTVTVVLYGALSPFLGAVVAGAFTGLTVFFLPGVFGFLVWELTGNWGLYRANRSSNLRPARVGHHGETLRGLLEPGFHSGTVPKLYARWRRLEGKAARNGTTVTDPRGRLPIEHAAESVKAFVAREVVGLLQRSPRWGGRPAAPGEVRLETNRVRAGLLLGTARVEVGFEYQGRWLVGRVLAAEGLADLDLEARAALEDALVGMYHLAGVDVAHEQLAALLGPYAGRVEWTADALRVWSGRWKDSERVYPLSDEDPLRARTPEGEPQPEWPALPADEVFWRRRPLAWSRWVAAWERDPAKADGPPVPLLAGVRLLPAG